MTRLIIMIMILATCSLFGKNEDSLKLALKQKKQLLYQIFKADSIGFQANNSGCFGGSRTTITVTKEKYHYRVIATSTVYGRSSNRKISKWRLNRAKRIFNKGFVIKSKLRCTSSESIWAGAGNKSVGFLDTTCRFHYMKKLEKALHVYRDLNVL